MKTPTREELDAIPVSDEEEREHIRYRQRVQHALDKARIPTSLEWALVLVDAATQVLVLQGMSRDFYAMLTDDMFAFSIEMLTRPPTPPKSLPERSTDVGRVQRLFSALRAAGVEPGNADTPAHLIGIAGDVFARNAVTPPMWSELCGYAYELAEKRVAAMGKKHQA